MIKKNALFFLYTIHKANIYTSAAHYITGYLHANHHLHPSKRSHILKDTTITAYVILKLNEAS